MSNFFSFVFFFHFHSLFYLESLLVVLEIILVTDLTGLRVITKDFLETEWEFLLLLFKLLLELK
jgi:hypothetical protein